MEFARAAAILEGVEQAPRLGVAAPLAEVDLVAAAAHEAVPQSRVRAARSWLFALGYLTADVDRADYDMALQVAVSAFQRESGLTVDGWIGEAETWPRLQELVAFERPLELAFWRLENGDAKPALRRAVRTRLAVYGFELPAPGVDDSALMPGVLRFLGVLGRLGAAPTEFAWSQAERIAVVMQHDRHVARAVAAAKPVSAHGSDREAFALLLNFAKVELWLAQADDIGLGKAYRGGSSGQVPLELSLAMKAYFRAAEDGPGVASLRTSFRQAAEADNPGAMLLAFLGAATTIGQQGDDPLAPENLDLLYQFYGSGSDDVPKRAAETVRALTGKVRFRARLWDGIRRIFSWLRRALQTAIRTGRRVLRLARDVARYAFQAASEGLRHISSAVSSFLGHLKTAIQRHHTDPRKLVHVYREFGRDVSVISSPRVSAPYLTAFTEQLRISAAIFRRSMAILGRAVALGLAVAGASISGPLVLRSLIGLARDLRQVVSHLGEISALQARHDALDEVLAAG